MSVGIVLVVIGGVVLYFGYIKAKDEVYDMLT